MQYQQYASYIFMVHKNHCKADKPLCHVTAVERAIISFDHKYEVVDHDHTKYSVICGVTVTSNIPENIDR